MTLEILEFIILLCISKINTSKESHEIVIQHPVSP